MKNKKFDRFIKDAIANTEALNAPDANTLRQAKKAVLCPECGEEVWDVQTVDQRLNKCWKCGLRFDSDEDAEI